MIVRFVRFALPQESLPFFGERYVSRVLPALGPYLAQILAKEVADRTGAAPLVSADVTAMLGFERNKRMLGCSEEDSQCLAEITGALGVDQVLASSLALSGGRYLLTGSADYIHWLTPQWGGAVFYDVGDAADSAADWNANQSYGVGARYKTPAGPLALDLAYAQRDSKFRISFSVSVAF